MSVRTISQSKCGLALQMKTAISSVLAHTTPRMFPEGQATGSDSNARTDIFASRLNDNNKKTDCKLEDASEISMANGIISHVCAVWPTRP